MKRFLHSGLDHVQRVHDQDLGDTCHGASRELVDEGKRLRVGHCASVSEVWLRCSALVAVAIWKRRASDGAVGRSGEGCW